MFLVVRGSEVWKDLAQTRGDDAFVLHSFHILRRVSRIIGESFVPWPRARDLRMGPCDTHTHTHTYTNTQTRVVFSAPRFGLGSFLHSFLHKTASLLKGWMPKARCMKVVQRGVAIELTLGSGAASRAGGAAWRALPGWIRQWPMSVLQIHCNMY